MCNTHSPSHEPTGAVLVAVFSRVDDVAGPPNLVTLTTTLSILSTDASVMSTVRSQTHVLIRRTYIGRTFVELHQSNVIYNIHRHVTVRPVCVCARTAITPGHCQNHSCMSL